MRVYVCYMSLFGIWYLKRALCVSLGLYSILYRSVLLMFEFITVYAFQKDIITVHQIHLWLFFSYGDK